MIEKIVLDYLSDALKVPTHMQQPEQTPEQYVLLQKVGSGRRNHISDATFAIQSYGDSLFQAAELNEEVKAAMDDIILLDSVSSSKLNSDYNYTDTKRKKYRYQAVYDLTYFEG